MCKVILIHKSADGTKVMATHRNACKGSNESSVQQRNLNAYFSPLNPSARKIPSKLKKSITVACAEFAALDNRAFEMIHGEGFLDLAEKIFDSGQRMSTLPSLKITELLPDPTTVGRLRNRSEKLGFSH